MKEVTKAKNRLDARVRPYHDPEWEEVFHVPIPEEVYEPDDTIGG